MKKILNIVMMIFIMSLSFSQEVKWKITEDSNLEPYGNDTTVKLKINEIVIANYEKTSLNSQKNIINYLFYKDLRGRIKANSVIPLTTDELFSEKITKQEVIILPYYNFDILSKKDPDIFMGIINHTFNSLRGEGYNTTDALKYIIDSSGMEQLTIRNTIININANNEQYCWFFVEKIHKLNNGYKCEGYIQYHDEENIFVNNPCKGKHTLLLIYDGDYINVYEDSEDKLLMKYAITNEKTFNEFNNLILTENCDLSKVTWPRHADGSSDYDNEIKPPKFNFAEIKVNPANSERAKENKIQEEETSITNVTKNKTMQVAEN